MVRQAKGKNGKPRRWQYLLYGCFLILGVLIIVGLPQYFRLRSNGSLEAAKALDLVCETFDVKVIDIRHRIMGMVQLYVHAESDTPAGEVEYFEIRLFPDSDTPEKLELSSSESAEFYDQVWGIMSEYRSAMDSIDVLPPESPYQWTLKQLSSGECLAIWYEEENPNELHLLSW